MTMETNARWLFLVSIAWLTGLTDFADEMGAFELDCGPSVTAEVGETVILPCLMKPQRDVSDETVEWLHGNDEVHLRWEGTDDFTNQKVEYNNRTSLFVDELSKGNCSLKLLNVRESDSGRYRCSVRINKETECTTDLTAVRPPGENNTSPGNQNPANSSTENPVLPRRENTTSNGTNPMKQKDNSRTISIDFRFGVGVCVAVIVLILGLTGSLTCVKSKRAQTGRSNNGTNNGQEMVLLNSAPETEPVLQQTSPVF